MDENKRRCPDCGEDVSRRDFIKAAAGAAAAASLAAIPAVRAQEPRSGGSPEELVKALYATLKPEQKKEVALPWGHPNRTKVDNNWQITKPRLGQFFTADQQQMIRDIVKGLCSQDGYERVMKMTKNDYGGFDKYHVAFFGSPESGKLHFALTGRHLTMRCDGDAAEGVVFGAPVFYGNAWEEFNEKPDHPGNVWWHQAKLANKVYAEMDGKQREKALVLDKEPGDTMAAVAIRKSGFHGIRVGDLSRDLKPLVEEVMRSLLSTYRASDVEEAMRYVKETGGLDPLHLAFYKDGNLGDDQVWDNWMIQGPTISWYFRGAPHVHTWVNIAKA